MGTFRAWLPDWLLPRAEIWSRQQKLICHGFDDERMASYAQIVIGAPYDDLNGLTRRPPPRGIARPLRVAFQICENAMTTLAANCLDGGFEMLAIIDGASPDVRSV